MMVNCSTSASFGRPATNATDLATLSASIIGSTLMLPSAWGVPFALCPESSVRALPMSSCVHMMPYFRPSSDVHLVRPRIACFVTVYAVELGRGEWAEMEPFWHQLTLDLHSSR